MSSPNLLLKNKRGLGLSKSEAEFGGFAALMAFTRRDVAYALVLLWALAGIGIKHAAVAAVAIPTWIVFGLVALTLAAAFFLRRPALQAAK